MDEKMKKELLDVFASKLNRSVRMYMENCAPQALATALNFSATCALRVVMKSIQAGRKSRSRPACRFTTS